MVAKKLGTPRRKTIRNVRTCALATSDPPVYLAAMPECSICRRSYDERFQVFIPPHPESFDRIECARQRGQNLRRRPGGGRPGAPTHDRSGRRRCATCAGLAAATAPPVAPRRAVAALAALAIAPGQAALTAGVGLFAAGSAASVYLAARPAGKPNRGGGALSTQRGARSTCRPPHSRTRLRLVRSPLPRRPELPSDAANRPAHVALHPTAAPCGRSPGARRPLEQGGVDSARFSPDHGSVARAG